MPDMLHSGRKVIVMAPFQIEHQNGQVNKKQRMFPRLRHCQQAGAEVGREIKGGLGNWELSIVERSRQHSIVDFVRLGRIVDFFIRIVSVCLHLPPICEKRFVAVLLLILLCQHLIVGNRCPGDHCGSAEWQWKRQRGVGDGQLLVVTFCLFRARENSFRLHSSQPAKVL